MVVQSSGRRNADYGSFLAPFQNMNKPNRNAGGPEPNVEPNTRKENQHKPEQQDSDEQAVGHGAMKGTDTPATTDAETAEREKGKRTTM